MLKSCFTRTYYSPRTSKRLPLGPSPPITIVCLESGALTWRVSYRRSVIIDPRERNETMNLASGAICQVRLVPFSSVHHHNTCSPRELEECSSGFDSFLDCCQIAVAFLYISKPAFLYEITLKVNCSKISVTIVSIPWKSKLKASVLANLLSRSAALAGSKLNA